VIQPSGGALRAAAARRSISPRFWTIDLRATGYDLGPLKAADDGTLVPLVLAMREDEKRAQQAEALLRPHPAGRQDPCPL
jgi:hypothetical protein